MDQSDRPDDQRGRPAVEGDRYEQDRRGDDSEAGTIRHRPRAEGDAAAQPPVQIALALLMLFLFLLVLWVVWPFLSGG